LIVKEYEGLSLRAAEVKQLLGIRIDHTVLYFWEKKPALYMEEIVTAILREVHKIEYSENFADSTIFANKKGIG